MKEVFFEKNVKKTFLHRFSCSETMLTLLDRAFGTEEKEIEEASDPLCGGICLELDAACGILWGASLAAGIQAQRRLATPAAARNAALTAAKSIVDSFVEEGNPEDCREIINMEKWGMMRYMTNGKTSLCLSNMVRQAPRFKEIIDSVVEEHGKQKKHEEFRNCATEAMEKVSKAIDLQQCDYPHISAGFAGGLGLSGNACGALASAIFTVNLQYFLQRNKPKHSMLRSMMQGFRIGDGWIDPSRKIVNDFREHFGTKSCVCVTNREFANPRELSEYLEQGNCSDVIDFLAQSAARHTAAKSAAA